MPADWALAAAGGAEGPADLVLADQGAGLVTAVVAAEEGLVAGASWVWRPW